MNETGHKLAKQEAWVSIAGNIVLFIAKMWVGIISGSIAIIADAWHTLSDSLTSVIVLAGVQFSARPADKEHPFGHGRAELIAALIIGVLLSVVAFNFLIEGVQRLINHQAANYGLAAIIVTAISTVGKEAMAQYAFWVSRRTSSRSVKADGWHHRSDAIASLVILVGIFAGKYLWWIDGLLGIIVAILIFHAAYMILRDAMNTMLGDHPEPWLITRIDEICRQESTLDLLPHHIHVHRYGEHTELTMHIKLPDSMTLFDAHEIATKIEVRLKNDLNIISTIHMEPVGFEHPRTGS